jgi:hypothetical protein
MFDFSFQLRPAEMIAAWRPLTERLQLRWRAAPRPGERVALRIEITGSPVAARVVGTVLGLRPEEEHHGLELAPDAGSLGAIGMLLAAARGEPVRFSRRPPRYLVQLPVAVSFRDAPGIRATTESVSEGGCALAWSGQPPTVGRVVRVRLDGGPAVAENQGAICWSAPASASSLAGVQFAGSRAPPAWSALVAAVARSGAIRA